VKGKGEYQRGKIREGKKEGRIREGK